MGGRKTEVQACMHSQPPLNCRSATTACSHPLCLPLPPTRHPPQSKTQVERDARGPDALGTQKSSLAVVRGQALAVNGVQCFTRDCAEPVAKVGGVGGGEALLLLLRPALLPQQLTTKLPTPAGDHQRRARQRHRRPQGLRHRRGSGRQAQRHPGEKERRRPRVGRGAACAAGVCLLPSCPASSPPDPSFSPLLLSPTPKQTNTLSADSAINGNDAAIGVVRGSSYSVQTDGLPAGSSATVQANAVAGVDAALWSGAGVASAQPFGGYGKKGAFVQASGAAVVNGAPNTNAGWADLLPALLEGWQQGQRNP